MNNANKPNGSVSGTTSPTGQQAEESKVSEADYVTQQAEQAKRAIAAVIGDMKDAISGSADVREWTRQYPWMLTGTAAVAGFVAGVAVTPPKEESFKDFFGEKWQELKDSLTPNVATETDKAQTARTIADQPASQEEKPSWFAVVLREVLKTVGPTIGGLITGALAGQQAQKPPHEGNGHPPQQAEAMGPPPTV